MNSSTTTDAPAESGGILDAQRSVPVSQHGSDANASTKGRATSCTSCRQVKLKCDLKAQYPAPCTRCKSQSLDCRTDANFRRVPARSRVRELETQLEQLKRTKIPEHVIPSASNTRSPETIGTQMPFRGPGFSFASSTTSASSPGTNSSAPGVWLNVHSTEPWESFVLEDVVLPASDVLDLFQQFEKLYYPHFCILHRVSSLSQLAQESPLLFWTINLVTSRTHARLHGQHNRIHQAHSVLYGRACLEAVQSLPDLQAVLMLCAWPNVHRSQQKDASWMHLGMAINAARHLGLDKANDEVLFGSRRAKYSISRHPPSIRRLTWLKAFELDIQKSLWLGHTPTLALAQHMRSIQSAIADPGVPRAYAAKIEVYLQAAMYLDAVSGGPDGQLSGNAMRQHLRALDGVKDRYSDAWNVDSEVAFLGAKLYLAALRLTSLSQDNLNSARGSTSGLPAAVASDDPFPQEALRTARLTAVQLANTLTTLSWDLLSSPSSAHHLPASHPLPGYPQFTSLLAYFTAVVLLKYLDSVGANSEDPEAEAARNAFSAIFQMFRQATRSLKHADATVNLELAGRAIGNGQAHIEDYVTTRMGASLMYNVIWTAAYLRGRHNDPEFTLDAAVKQTVPAYPAHHEAQIQPQLQSQSEPSLVLPQDSVSLGGSNTMPYDPQQGWSLPVSDAGLQPDFPFGVWDDAVYDNWANGTWTDVPADWNMDYGMLDGIAQGVL